VSSSLVYHSPLVYGLAMRALYGRHLAARYRAVAELIPAGSSVLDVCCGPGALHHRYLRRKRVDYTGLDVNRRFVARVNRLGGRGLVWDLTEDRALPPADTVVMQASLYQFLPDPGPVVRRMLGAARERVIVAEPVRNLSTGNVPVLSAYARRHTDAGLGARPLRFTEPTLDAFFASLGAPICRSFLTPGGREKVYVLDPRPGTAVTNLPCERPAT
jgi:SAM-dependent methyltransferase